MDTKPPTRTLPKLVMKEWPILPVLQDSDGRERRAVDNYGDIECPFCDVVISSEHMQGPLKACWRCESKILSDFTRVVEETGILEQERSQKDGSR